MDTRTSEQKGQNKSVCTVNAQPMHAHWLLCSLESLRRMLGCLSFIYLPLGGARVAQKTMTHEEVQKGLRHDTRSTVFNVWIFKSLWWITMNLLNGCCYGGFCPSLQSCCMSSAGRRLKYGLENSNPSSQCAGSVSHQREGTEPTIKVLQDNKVTKKKFWRALRYD